MELLPFMAKRFRKVNLRTTRIYLLSYSSEIKLNSQRSELPDSKHKNEMSVTQNQRTLQFAKVTMNPVTKQDEDCVLLLIQNRSTFYDPY